MVLGCVYLISKGHLHSEGAGEKKLTTPRVLEIDRIIIYILKLPDSGYMGV